MFGFQTQPNNKDRALLYVVVFGNAYVKFITILLFTFFVLNPVFRVEAAEEVVVDDAPAEKVAESEPKPEPEPEVEEVELSDEELVSEEAEETTEEFELESDSEEVSEEVDVATDNSELVSEAENDQESTESKAVTSESDTVVETEVITESEVVADIDGGTDSGSTNEAGETDDEISATSTNETEVKATSTEVVNNTGSSSGNGNEVDLNDSELEVGTSTDNLPHSPTTTATSTTEEAESVDTTDSISENVIEVDGETDSAVENYSSEESINENESVSESESEEVATTTVPEPQIFHTMEMEDDSRHSFSLDECQSVGDGSFYCSKSEGVTSAIAEDVVYAQLDSDGDSEIYARIKGKVTALTDNSYEDLAPAYDEVDQVVVWHRLISGRYQIMLYDLEAETEVQLTRGDSNSMEPTHEDGVTVWQQWHGDNWEIMLRTKDEVKQITFNEVHDVAPDIQGGYVIWNTFDDSGEMMVAVYDVETGLTSYIADNEGGQVVNPRFVLVYDTKFANGDIITKGYDPETGDVVPLSAQGAPEPLDIPSPEPTGETQALIQNKSANNKDEVIEAITGTSTTPITGTTTDSVATSSDNLIITIPEIEVDDELIDSLPSEIEAETETASTTVTDALPLDEFDLIVEPFSGSSSAQVSDSATSFDSVE